MQRGLEGRRVAVLGDAHAGLVRDGLTRAGAIVDHLADGGQAPEAAWHSGRYTALVVMGHAGDARAVQLVREFLVAGKPIASFGDGRRVVEEAGGADDDVVHAGTTDARAFADGLGAALARRLEEAQVDEMSDLSFPASDPPAVSPAAIGTASRRRPDARG